MTYQRLNRDALATLGGAFAAGYDSKAAKLHFVEGLSFSPEEDLSLALGWPFLLELEPALDPADPVKEVLARLNATVPPRRWPIDLATRAVRLLATGYVRFPDEPKPESVKAASRPEPFEKGEAKKILTTLFARPVPGWRHAPWVLNALEALGGGADVVDTVLDGIEEGERAWEQGGAMPMSVVTRVAHIVRRLPEKDAEPRRKRAKKLLDAAMEEDPDLLTEEDTMDPVRRLVLVVDEPELIRQGGEKFDDVLTPYDATFLPAKELLAILRSVGKPTEGSEPSARYVVAGGPEVLDIELGRWAGYGAGGDKASAHAYVIEQYGKLRLPGAVAIIADMADKSAAKKEALAWLERHAAFAQPILAELAKSSSPARAGAEKALKALSKQKPS